MTNELLLILSLVVLYGAVLLWFYLFGPSGLMAFTVFATITANIEVMILVDAFGIEMTLGNILFATTFLVTDILSEVSGKKAAQQAVWAGIAANVFFIIVSQSWLMYIPSANDVMSGPFHTVFSNTPRMMIASLAVYAISQAFDVWLYHRWWAFSEKKSGDRHRFLWLRNNGSTLVSQFLNAVLFNVFAFYGTYDANTLFAVTLSSYLIYIATSLLDTPVIYMARAMYEKNYIRKAALEAE